MSSSTPAFSLDLSFDEAVAYYEAKGLKLSPDSWRDLWETAHARAFTVARVTEMDMLMDIKIAVDRAIADGVRLDEFQEQLTDLLSRRGWFAPTGKDAIMEMPDGTKRKRLTPWRIETIYRTNMQSAYSVGRYEQMMEVADSRPYWCYMAIMDGRTRPGHAAMNGMTYRYDDPIWSEWYPPNGFNCRCYVKTLSARQVSDREIPVQMGPTDVLPDEGWRYHVGQAGMNPPDVDLDAYPEELAAYYRRDRDGG